MAKQKAMGANCKSCSAEIRWAVTVNGKKIPIDWAPVANGNITLSEREGLPPIAVMVTAQGDAFLPALQPSAEAPRYVSHFATCPAAAAYRGK